MLQDFYLCELYFGTVESAQSLESLIEQYGRSAVMENIRKGYLHLKSIRCPSAPSGAAVLCWLSPSGRLSAEISQAGT
ncbi:MAG: hypothetical protein ACK4VI_05270 [Alphaproteobacteria bacterium]